MYREATVEVSYVQREVRQIKEDETGGEALHDKLCGGHNWTTVMLGNNSKWQLLYLIFRHRASCILGQAFHYSPENAFYIFNQQIYFII